MAASSADLEELHESRKAMGAGIPCLKVCKAALLVSAFVFAELYLLFKCGFDEELFATSTSTCVDAPWTERCLYFTEGLCRATLSVLVVGMLYDVASGIASGEIWCIADASVQIVGVNGVAAACTCTLLCAAVGTWMKIDAEFVPKWLKTFTNCTRLVCAVFMLAFIVDLFYDCVQAAFRGQLRSFLKRLLSCQEPNELHASFHEFAEDNNIMEEVPLDNHDHHCCHDEPTSCVRALLQWAAFLLIQCGQVLRYFGMHHNLLGVADDVLEVVSKAFVYYFVIIGMLLLCTLEQAHGGDTFRERATRAITIQTVPKRASFGGHGHALGQGHGHAHGHGHEY
eukprot:TRINITY_DN49600_c0_g1_i1.p1 TRINITY_DN49600_c0_g1~~TRINITY_DN49600_c0_g1_i1.p1  ORF type:complete len:370 (-),score=47.56 TRINITY_DN49600_c0_g1_i1:352-1371(-)